MLTLNQNSKQQHTQSFCILTNYHNKQGIDILETHAKALFVLLFAFIRFFRTGSYVFVLFVQWLQ